ncbi:inactive 2'-5'-oligoadenylate synthase 1D-like isoform X1 [Arvicanthis niloticus]|uniref:inactive 2'-5'-oligoadenylate synthase 1D-like isoform X1 n=1 Tax=Arvicanthis niloticus TaxID=61156 RepID=UPI00402B1D67
MCIQPMMPCINYKHLGWDIYNIIYAQLIGECTTLNKEGEFSMCFIDLQQKFLRDRPPELWNVIRLVKHWYQLGGHGDHGLWIPASIQSTKRKNFLRVSRRSNAQANQA